MYTIQVIEDLSGCLPNCGQYDPVWGLAPKWKDSDYLFRNETVARCAALSAVSGQDDPSGTFKFTLSDYGLNMVIVQVWFVVRLSDGSVDSYELLRTDRYGWR